MVTEQGHAEQCDIGFPGDVASETEKLKPAALLFLMSLTFLEIDESQSEWICNVSAAHCPKACLCVGLCSLVSVEPAQDSTALRVLLLKATCHHRTGFMLH